MSKLILWGSSALDFYQHGDFTSLPTLWLDIAHQEDITPNAAAVQYLEDRLPWLSKPFRIIVPSRQQKRNLNDVRCHVAEASIQQDRYFRIAQGLFAPSPEVAFLQSNWSHDLAEVIFKGSTLCGAYGLTPPFDTVFNRPVLTSSERIQEALLAHRDIRGCAMTRRAAPWILDNAASPREAALALLMTLPNHLGGYHFARPRLNHSIELTGAARPLSRKEYYVADVCWPAQRLILEYDSDERHLTSEQLQEDAVASHELPDHHRGTIAAQLNQRNKENRALCCPRTWQTDPIPHRRLRCKAQASARGPGTPLLAITHPDNRSPKMIFVRRPSLF